MTQNGTILTKNETNSLILELKNMFFILSKALLFFISPLFWIIASLIGFLLSKSGKTKKRFKYLTLGLLFFFTNTVIFLSFCGLWEIEGTPISRVKKHDVGIVLGGMSEYNNDLKTISLRRGGDRIWQAITLYKKGKIKKILISGDSGYVSDRGLHEAQQMRSILIDWGIPAKDVWSEDYSKNTHENAVFSKRVLQSKKALRQSYLLITSGTHMRRSLACFKKVNLTCTPFSTDLYTGPKSSFYWDQYLVPEADNLSDWHKLIKEWVGFVAYGLTGRI